MRQGPSRNRRECSGTPGVLMLGCVCARVLESGRRVIVGRYPCVTCCSVPCDQCCQADAGLQIMPVRLRRSAAESCACTFLFSKRRGGEQRLWLLHRVALWPSSQGLPSSPCTHEAGPCLASLEPLRVIVHSQGKITPALKAPASNQRKGSISGCTCSVRVLAVVEAEHSRRLCG